MLSGAKIHAAEMCFDSMIRKQKYLGEKQTRKTTQLFSRELFAAHFY